MKPPTHPLRKLPVALIAGLGGLVTIIDAPAAQPWAICYLPLINIWETLASSADGTTLIAATGLNPYARKMPIYISTNAGASWIQTASPTNAWTGAACSADGTRMAAVAVPYRGWGTPHTVYNSGVFVSHDSGATWARTSAPTNYWTAITSSADGRTLVAASGPIMMYDPDSEEGESLLGDGLIYRSLDYGQTWTRTTAPTNNWTSIASSADGAKLFAVSGPRTIYDLNSPAGEYIAGDGLIYRSLDSGQTWTQTSAPNDDWTSVTASADGVIQMAAARAKWNSGTQREFGGGLCLSLDSGVTWNRIPPPSTNSLTSEVVRCTADGSRWFAGGDQVYTSRDLGRSWEALGGPSSAHVLAVSADGFRVIGGWWDPLQRLPYFTPWRLTDPPASDLREITHTTDDTRWIALSYPDILSSTNAGNTWIRHPAPTTNLTAIASSQDGNGWVAAAWGSGTIYTSTNAGTVWLPGVVPPLAWTAVASSANGSNIVVIADDRWDWDGTANHLQSRGAIYGSMDSGMTWRLADAPTNNWRAVTCSAEGTQWIAVSGSSWDWVGRESRLVRPGEVYRSSDGGASWNPTTAPALEWSTAAFSADGKVLLAAGSPYLDSNLNREVGQGGIYRSLDLGATWALTTAPTNRWVSSLASSADGRQWLASVGYYILISTDSGATWRNADAPAAQGWGSVVSSADGNFVLALSDEGSLASLHAPSPEPPQPPSPRLSVGLSGPDLDLSWLIPSTRFILQQTAALGSGGWEDVSTPPTLDLTNLHHQVILSPSPGNRYFRLKQQ